jgi:bacillithiol synthase
VECSSYPFDKLPFSELFCDYISQKESLRSFYKWHPFDNRQIKEITDQFHFRGNRDLSADALISFNKKFDAPEITITQIEKLRESDSIAVVTGQQLTLYGGPLFTVYKTLTAIIYAKKWQKLLNRTVIPVFWMADEDHDYEEAGEIGLLNEDSWDKLILTNGKSGKPVGRELLGESFSAFENELFEILPESDFTKELTADLKRFYQTGNSFRDAFGRWFLHLFAKHGVILAGSDDPGIKKLTFQPMQRAVENSLQLYKELDSQSSDLEKNGYKRQALVQDSNLFYIDPDNGRVKLEQIDGKWHSGNSLSWDNDKLISEIRAHPEKFSPNVFLRPLLQDSLIPSIAYVAGPGELAYYGQMKRTYEWMQQPMPILIPRFSVTLVEPAIDRIMNELPIEMHEYSERIEDLESKYLDRTGSYDVEKLFIQWREQVGKITDETRKKIARIDPTLEASADKTGTIFENELEKLKKKVYRSIKNKESIQINRIKRIKENLFPGGSLQERQIAMIFYMNKYGPDLWDRLLDTLDGEIPDTHKLVRL